MIDIQDLDLGEEIFTWEDPSTGEILHFATTRLVAFLKESKHEIGVAPILESWVESVIKFHGVEYDHLERIADARLIEPIVVIDHGDGEHTTIDGVHRLIKLYRRGRKFVHIYMVQPDVWKRFLVTGIPVADESWRAYLRDPNSRAINPPRE